MLYKKKQMKTHVQKLNRNLRLTKRRISYANCKRRQHEQIYNEKLSISKKIEKSMKNVMLEEQVNYRIQLFSMINSPSELLMIDNFIFIVHLSSSPQCETRYTRIYNVKFSIYRTVIAK